MNRRTKTVLTIIVLIVIAVVVITRWQRNVATQRLLEELPRDDYARVMDAMTQLQERGGAIVPALLNYLQSPEPAARWRAATLLGDVGGPRVWDALERALADDSPEVRAAAALALGKLKAKPAVQALSRLLGDVDEALAVRIASASALGLIHDRDGTSALTSALADRMEAQQAAVFTAREAADDAAAAVDTARETLQTAATADEITAAREALDAATEAAATAAEKARAVEERYPEAAEAVVAAAPPPPPAPAPAPAEGEEADQQEGEQEVEPAAAPVPTEEPPPPPADTTWELRLACARALGLIGDPAAVRGVSEAMDAKHEPHAEVRVAAAYALGDVARRVTDKEESGIIISGFVRALDDEVGDVRAASLHSLGFAVVPKTAEKQVEDALVRGLNDEFYWSREAARETMKRLNIVVAG